MVSIATDFFYQNWCKHVNDLYVSFVTTVCSFPISRFELPGIGGLNFVLSHSLGGGGVASLRIDPQVGVIMGFVVHKCRSLTPELSLHCQQQNAQWRAWGWGYMDSWGANILASCVCRGRHMHRCWQILRSVACPAWKNWPATMLLAPMQNWAETCCNINSEQPHVQLKYYKWKWNMYFCCCLLLWTTQYDSLSFNSSVHMYEWTIDLHEKNAFQPTIFRLASLLLVLLSLCVQPLDKGQVHAVSIAGL